MKWLTCAVLSLGLVVATCAGCYGEKKPTGNPKDSGAAKPSAGSDSGKMKDYPGSEKSGPQGSTKSEGAAPNGDEKAQPAPKEEP